MIKSHLIAKHGKNAPRKILPGTGRWRAAGVTEGSKAFLKVLR